MISTGFTRLMSCGPHSITGEMSVLSGVSGRSRNNCVSLLITPKKIAWLVPAGIAPLGTMILTSESDLAAHNSPPVVLNVASARVMYFTNDVEGRLLRVSLFESRSFLISLVFNLRNKKGSRMTNS